MLRYFNFEPSFKLQFFRARDLFGSQIPVTTGGFELQISYIRSSFLTHLTIRPNRSGGVRVPKFQILSGYMRFCQFTSQF